MPDATSTTGNRMPETPFPIASLPLATGGRIGVCPLPGSHAGLARDLAAIAAWRPVLVVSMTEQRELDAAGCGDLTALLAERDIGWAHLPIPDFGVLPGDGARHWPALSQHLHAILDRGDAVLLHCYGGRGRSGMIALRLLVERGEDPETALARLRRERPGAVETEAQLAWASHP